MTRATATDGTTDFVTTRHNFDPTFPYMVFEWTATACRPADAAEVFAVLAELKLSVLDTVTHTDPARRRCLMTVKLAPEVTAAVMDDILRAGLPFRFTCWFYRRRSPRIG